jgi:hypothetical protein
VTRDIPPTEIRKGDRYWSQTMGATIEVFRVSRQGLWADIFVQRGQATWTKRQPLIDGRFGFQAEQL